jgi:hypothetical protein
MVRDTIMAESAESCGARRIWLPTPATNVQFRGIQVMHGERRAMYLRAAACQPSCPEDRSTGDRRCVAGRLNLSLMPALHRLSVSTAG